MDHTQIQNLISQQALPETTEKTELIETHISYIILTPSYAYKIKKPVRFSFLDFSSLEKRKFYTHQELKLNRRLVPKMYKDVWPLYIKENQYSLNQKGEIADYVLVMQRIDSTYEMDKLLEAGKVTQKGIKNIALIISDFQKSLPGEAITFSKERYKENFNDIDVVSNFIEKWYKAGSTIIKNCMDASDMVIDQFEHAFHERINNGLVKDCHGDLHSKNIFLLPEKTVIFDCIEFNASFRQIDVLSEVAYFCMDLEDRNAQQLSHYFIREYLNFYPDAGDMHDKSWSLFLYFKMYRANIRAKVEALKQKEFYEEQGIEPDFEECKSYLSLMEEYRQQLAINNE